MQASTASSDNWDGIHSRITERQDLHWKVDALHVSFLHSLACGGPHAAGRAACGRFCFWAGMAVWLSAGAAETPRAGAHGPACRHLQRHLQRHAQMSKVQ